MTRHKVSKYEHPAWAYYVCGEHGRHYSTLKEVEIDHPEGYVIVVKKPCLKPKEDAATETNA